jgi:predicted AAA+ superfamily ATPase
MYKFDLKTNKYISSRAKYFFSDLWIRNSFNQFSTDRESLIENLVFNDLYSLWYEIYWWINGKFDFSFIAEKNNSRLYIHLSKETHKEDIKKEVRKLLKIWDEHKKYLIVDDLENLWLKKFKYDSVEIITLKDFFNTIKT